jgi:hypothetical protein
MTSITKTLLAIRHVGFEDLGGFEAPLQAAVYAICCCDMGPDELQGIPAPDLLTVPGGPLTKGISTPQLRAPAREYGTASGKDGQAVLASWLTALP